MTTFRFGYLLFSLLLLALPCSIAWAEEKSDSTKDNDAWIGHGFLIEDYQALKDHLQTSVDEGRVPGGAMLLMHDGEVIFRQEFGYGHLRRKIRFSADDPFLAASISKPIIATLLVKLGADGIVDLDEPIDERLPVAGQLKLASGEAPSSMPTLRQCLHHSAGFRADQGPGTRPWLKWRHKGYSLADVVEKESNITMRSNPGRRFAYSGIGYDIAGRVVEIATGRPLEDVLQQSLCVPLGMTQTTFYPEKDKQLGMPSFYWLHRSDGSFKRRLDQPIIHPNDYTSVGGGIVTTIDDLAKFLLMHQEGGRVNGEPWIEERSLQPMYIRKSPGSFYGLGFTLGPADLNGYATWISHTGSSGTLCWCDRQRKMIGVIATQHSFTDGDEMPESEKRISVETLPWTKQTKIDFIDPVFGWES